MIKSFTIPDYYLLPVINLMNKIFRHLSSAGVKSRRLFGSAARASFPLPPFQARHLPGTVSVVVVVSSGPSCPCGCRPGVQVNVAFGSWEPGRSVLRTLFAVGLFICLSLLLGSRTSLVRTRVKIDQVSCCLKVTESPGEHLEFYRVEPPIILHHSG